AMRTGAAGGVAAKYLARPDTRTVGIVGAGVQARTQLMAVASVLKGIEEVRVTDLRNESRETFAREMSSTLGLEMVSVESTEAAVRGSDLVVATVPTREPCIRSEWIEDGAHVNAIGGDAPGKQELSMDFWTRAKIVVDDWEQAFHSGDINVPCAQCLISKKDVWAELGDIVAGKREGRTSDREVTVFDSTGVAVQDAMAADLVYRNALERNMGRDLEM
ncbi:MAG: ornithine cyclodeaminase family protein, partial [Methanomassiliicoccales archaeon]